MNTDDDTIKIPKTFKHSSNLVSQFTEFYNKGEMTDFCLMTGDKVFPCHRVILAANSAVLHGMITTAITNHEEQSNLVVIDSIPEEIMAIVLEYMYTGEGIFHQTQLLELVLACDNLHLLELRAFCLDKVPDFLSTALVLNWSRVATLLQLDRIRQKCKELIQKSFKQIAQTDQFLELGTDELIDFIEEAKRGSATEDEMIKYVFRWIDHDIDNRMTSLQLLLKNMHPEHCSWDVLHDIMHSYSYHILEKDAALHKLLTETLVSSHIKHSEGEEKPDAQSMIVIEGNTEGNCWKFDKGNKTTWNQMFKITAQIGQSHSVCLYKDIGLLFTGGYKLGRACFLYKFAEETWKKLPDMMFSKSNHVSVCLDGVLFVMGGGFCSSTVYSLDVDAVEDAVEEAVEEDGDSSSSSSTAAAWQEQPQLPEAQMFPKLAQHDDTIFIMWKCTPTLVAFNTQQKPTNRSWRKLQSMPENPGGGYSVATVLDKILVAGGFRKVCFWYTINSDIWFKTCAPSLVHTWGAMVFVNNTLYLVGGYSKDVEQYTIGEYKWTVSEFKLPKALDNFHAFAFA